AWASMLWSPMDADEMAGTGMVMAPSVGEAVAFVAAWGVMMAAMMLPSALPMIGLYAATQRSAPGPAAKAAAIASFVLMYLVVWALTGLPIYVASVALMAVASVTLAYAIAGVLVVAGLFQLSPLKQVCLRRCRSPLGFLLGHWRAGWRCALPRCDRRSDSQRRMMMANVQWTISGEYFEACSCDSVCPCPTSGLAARPTKGSCDAGLVFHVQRGQYGSIRLDGLSFAVLLHTPGAMIQG